MTCRPGLRVTGPALALAVGLLALLPAVAAAQEAPPAADAPRTGVSARLVISDITGVLGPGSTPPEPAEAEEGSRPTASGGGPGAPTADTPPPTDLGLQLLIENDGGRALGDLRVVAEVYEPAGTRSTLRAALDEQAPAGARVHLRDRTIRDGDGLQPGGVAGLSLTVDGEAAGWTGEDGVYPVSLALVRGRQVLDRVVTAVVYLEEQPAGPLLTTVVWPLTGEPWRAPGGAYPSDVDRAIRPGGRLDVLLGAVEDNTAPAVQLAPAAHLLEDLADRADGFMRTNPDGDTRRVGRQAPPADRASSFLERIRTTVEALPLSPLAAPYGEVHLAAMAERPGTLTAMAGRAVTEGRQRIARLTGRYPDDAAALPWVGLTPAAVDLMSSSHLLLDYEHLAGAPDTGQDPTIDVPPALRTVGSRSGRPVTATVADPYVADTIENPRDQHGVEAAVQRTLAETAMMFFQAPATSGRPLLILPPADWDPDRRFATALIDGLGEARWLQLGRAAKQTVAAGARPRRAALAAPPDPLTAALAGRIERLQSRLRAAAAATPGTAPVGSRPRNQLADQLLRTPSRWFLDGTGLEAEAMADGVASAVEDAFGDVAVPSAATVTLTSEEGEIPVTVERTTGGPIRVRVSVRSTAGLRWPEGRDTEPITLQPGASETVSFPVRAVSRGRLPVTVRITDPTGSVQLTRARVSVRSTAILSSGALVVVGTAVVLLLGVGLVRRRSPGAGEHDRRFEVVE